MSIFPISLKPRPISNSFKKTKPDKLWKNSEYKNSHAEIEFYFSTLLQATNNDLERFAQEQEKIGLKMCIRPGHIMEDIHDLPTSFVTDSINEAKKLANFYLITNDIKFANQFIEFFNNFAKILESDNCINEDPTPEIIKDAAEEFEYMFISPSGALIH